MAIQINWEIVSLRELKKRNNIKVKKQYSYIWLSWFYIQKDTFDLCDFNVIGENWDTLKLKTLNRRKNIEFTENKNIKELTFNK